MGWGGYLCVFDQTVQRAGGDEGASAPLLGGEELDHGTVGGLLLLLGLVQSVDHQLHHRLMDTQSPHQIGVLEKHLVVHQLPEKNQKLLNESTISTSCSKSRSNGK